MVGGLVARRKRRSKRAGKAGIEGGLVEEAEENCSSDRCRHRSPGADIAVAGTAAADTVAEAAWTLVVLPLLQRPPPLLLFPLVH